MSAITNTVQQIAATDIREIVVTPLTTQTDGTFIRAVRFYGDPFIDGAPSLLLTVTCTSSNHDDLVVQVPTPVNY